jgi:hypothetical protein
MTKIFTPADLILAHYKELEIPEHELNEVIKTNDELCALQHILHIVAQHIDNTETPSDHVLAALEQAARNSHQTTL